MKTTQNTTAKTPCCFPKPLMIAHWVQRLLAASAIFLGVIGTMLHANSTLVYSVNIVGCVPDMTIELLTAPLTPAQQQMLHARNFNSLPPLVRPVYLHAVTYAVGFASGSGQLPTSDLIMEHLKSIPSIYEVPAVPPEVAQSVNALLPAIDTTMKSLNALISVSNSGYSQAMFAGAVCGIINTSGRCLDFP